MANGGLTAEEITTLQALLAQNRKVGAKRRRENEQDGSVHNTTEEADL